MGMLKDRFDDLEPYISEIRRAENGLGAVFTFREHQYIYDAIKKLRPLSHTKKVVECPKLNKYVAVGRFLRWSSDERITRRDHIGHRVTSEDVTYALYYHGYEIAQYVRRPIKETFRAIVDEVKRMYPWENVPLKKKINRNISIPDNTVQMRDYSSFFNVFCKSFTINTTASSHVKLDFDDDSVNPIASYSFRYKSLNIMDTLNYMVFEDFISELREVYNELNVWMDYYISVNKEKLNNIQEVVKPYLVKEKLQM